MIEINNTKISTKPRWQKNLLNVLKIAVSLGAIYWFSKNIDWHELGDTLLNVNWVILIIAFSVFALRLLPLGIRWVHISEVAGYPISSQASIHWYYVGGFFNVFLPTGRGGDVVRGLFASRQYHYPFGATMIIILLERLIGMLVSLCFLFAVTLIAINKVSQLKDPLISMVILIGILALSIYICFHPVFRRIISRLFNRLKLNKLSDLSNQLFTVMDKCWKNPKEIFLISAFSCLNQILFIVSGYLVGLAIHGFGAPWYSYPIVIPLIFLSELLPSIGGYGVREAGFLIFFEWFGVNNDAAAVYGIIQLFFLWGSALIGAVLFVKGSTVERKRKFAIT
jgi:glycosyltransferase 2 family protein